MNGNGGTDPLVETRTVPGAHLSGFTLMETCLAIAVIGMVAVPLAGILAMSAEGSRAAEFRQDAAELARRIVADLGVGEAAAGGLRPPWLRGAEARRSLFLACDETGQALWEVGPGEFEAGVPGRSGEAGAVHCLAELRFQREEVLSSGQNLEVRERGGGEPPYGLLSLRITGPGSIPLRNRHVEGYITRILLTDEVQPRLP